MLCIHIEDKFIFVVIFVTKLLVSSSSVSELYSTFHTVIGGECHLAQLMNRDVSIFAKIMNEPYRTVVAWNMNFTQILSNAASSEIVFISSRNFSEFILILDMIRIALKRRNWTEISPFFFIQFPFVNESNDSDDLLIKMMFSQYQNTDSFPLDSNIYLYHNSNTTEFQVYEMYSIGKKLQIQAINLGKQQYFVLSNYLGKAVRRRNFQYALILPTAYNDPDYRFQVKWKIKNDGNVELVSGIAVELFLTLEFSLNFTHRVVVGDGWVHKTKNGTWTGMGKLLRNSEADISISLSTMLPERLEGLDFLHALAKVPSQAFFRQPESGTMRDILIAPMNISVWISLLGIWILLLISLRIIYKAHQDTQQLKVYDNELLNGSLLWILSTSCQQGWYTYPSANSLRIVFITGSFFGFVYFIIFSAALVPILYIDSVPIKTIEELGQSHLEILCDDGFPNGDKRVEEIEFYRQKIKYKKPDKAEQFIKIDDAIPQLIERDTAFLTFHDGFLSVLHRHNFTDPQICSTFHTIPLTRIPSVASFTLKKGSEYKEFFNHRILMIQESGISSRNFRIYNFLTTAKCKDHQRNKPGEMQLSIPDISTAYVILGGGAALSILAILVECLLAGLKNVKYSLK